MKEISKEKTFYEMAETVFQERKEKLETLKKREKDEKLKRREERLTRIAKTFLQIFRKSTNYTQNSQDFVTQIYIIITYCCGMAKDSDCGIITSNNKCYNTENCSNTPNYRYLGEYLAKIRSANLTNEDLGEIDRYFLKTNGFYTRHYGDACSETLIIGINE